MQERESRSLPLARRSLARLLGGCLALALVFAAAPQLAQAQSNALVVDTATLWVVEGESETFEVKLSQAPTGDVTVTVASADTAIATVSPASLTFTTGNWNTEQDVTVTGAQDSDSQDESVQVNLTASDGGYAGVTGSKDVSVADDEAAGLVVTPLSLDVSAPSGFTAAPGDREIALSWTDPLDASITKWQVRHKAGTSFTAAGDLWTDIVGSTASTTGHTVTGLTNNTAYVFQVRAVNATGDGAASVVQPATPQAVAPGKPQNVTAAPGNASALLTWDAMASATLWQVRYQEGDADWTDWTDIPGSGSGTASHRVTGLTNGTAYLFRVRALRDGVAGPRSDNFGTTPVLSAPYAPTGFAATAGDGQVALSWADPQDASITKWQVRHKAGTSFTAADDLWTDIAGSTASTTGHTVTGLTNATQYVFEVRAVSAQGTGAASAAVTATPAAPPSAPSGFTAAPGDREIALSWTDPLDASITKWQVRHKAGTSFTAADDLWTDIVGSTASTTGHTMTGLTNNTAYVFQVRAVNATGDGAASVVQPATPQAVAPGKPQNVTAAPGNASALLTWDAMASATLWQVRYQEGDADWTDWTDIPGSGSGTASHRVTGLTNGTAYLFRVRALRDGVAGPRSDNFGTTPVLSAPYAPTGFAATAGDGQVALSWADPQDASITKWQVRHKAGTSFTAADDLWTDIAGSTASTTGHTVTGLTNATQYVFEVRAVSAQGTGAASAAVTATPAAPPSAPSGFTAAPGDREIALSWTDPLDASITKWQVRHKAGTSFTAADDLWTDIVGSTASTTGHTVTGLTNNTAYVFQVRAVNATGDGAASVVQPATPQAVAPGKPQNVTAAPGNASALLTWDAMASATLWQVRYQEGDADWTDWTDIPGSGSGTASHRVTGLTNGTAYLFRVRALRDGVAGPRSDNFGTTPVLSAPYAPTGFAATAGDGQVALSWADPQDASITKWQVRHKAGTSFTAADDLWTDIAGSTASTTGHTVTGLTNATQYVFEVRAVSAQGTGAASAAVTATPAAPPSAPSGFTAAPGDREIALSWTDPLDASITKWQVRHKAGTSFTAADDLWTDIVGSTASTTGHTVTGLTNNTAYVFQVRAVNATGDGAASVVQPATPQAVAPGKPQNVTAAPGNASALLTWDAMASATLWQVRYQEGDADWTDWTDIPGSGSGTASHRVTGLTNGTAYLFRVRALRDGVAGPRSDNFGTTPVLSAPYAPTGFAATAGDGQVALSWADPQDASITKWQVRHKAGTSFTAADDLWTDIAGSTASTTGHTVTGLTNATQYVFEVRAVSAQGTGAASAAVTATPAAPPSAPSGFTAAPGDREIALSWTDPLDASITKWQVRHKAGTSFTAADDLWTDIVGSTASTTGHTVTGLTNNTAYVFQVRAVNATGDGAASVVQPATPQAVAPGKPQNVTAAPGNASALLTWDAMASATLWQVRYQEGDADWTDWTDIPGSGSGTASHRVTGLTNGTAYLFRVRALRDGVAGPRSDNFGTTPVLSAPYAPTGFAATAGDGQVALSWADPQDASITKWQVRHKAGTSFTAADDLWTDIAGSTASTTGHTVTGLTNATQYVFEVRAVSAQGTGAASAAVTATPAAPPSAPSGFTAAPGDREIALSWTDPLDASITKWQVRHKAGTSFTAADDLWTDIVGSTASTTGHTMTGLTNNTAYVFQVRAVNATGDGAASVVQPATPQAVAPGKPQNVTAAPGNASALLTWDAMASATLWQVRYQEGDADWTDWTDIPGSGSGTASHRVTGLTNGTAYLFRVRALRDGVAGPRSDNFGTTPAPDPALTLSVASLTVAEGGSGTFTVVLDAVPSGDVTVSLASDNTDVSVSPSPLTFTMTNWNVPQTVTVSAAADSDNLDDSAVVSLSASGGGYHGVTVSVSLTVLDQRPVAPANLLASAGSGQVKLRWDPLPSIDLWQVRKRTTGSGSAGWDSWVLVSPAVIAKGRLSHVVTGLTSGTTYDFQVRGGRGSARGESAQVTVTLLAEPALTLSSASLTVAEGGSGTFTVALATAPSADVTVSVTQDAATANADVTVDKTSLTFTTGNYSTAQTVTVSAAQDADGDDDSATLLLSASGGDYGSVTGSVDVTVTDDDEAPAQPTGFAATSGDGQVSLSWTDPSDASITKWQVRHKAGTSFADTDDLWTDIAGSGASTTSHTVTGLTNGTQYVFQVRAVNAVGAGAESAAVTATPAPDPALTVSVARLSIDEGSSDTFTVILDAAPTGNVTVSLASDNADVSVSSTALTFTAANWATAQTVTVTTLVDADDLDDSAVVSLSASGGGYTGLTASISVAVLDQRPVAPGNLLASAGPGQVELSWAPLLAIDLWQVRKRTTGSGSAGWGSWALVSPAVIAEGRLSHTVTGLTSGTTYDFQVRGGRGSARGESAQVTVTLLAEPALTLSSASLTVAEGGSGTFTVALATAPSADVTVSVTQDAATANADVTVDKTSLTFTTGNYSTAQTVTVSAAQDADGDDDSATLLLSASGGDYGSVTGSVDVTVTDDDEAPAQPTGFAATSGDGQVALSWTDPSDVSITKWQVRHRAGTSFADTDDLWTDIAGSGASTTSHTVTGLTNGTQYVFQVRAVNAVGAGAASADMTETPEAPNNAPTVANAIADQSVVVGSTLTVDLEASGSEVFADADGDTLTYTATSEAPGVAAVSLSGTTLTVTGGALGTAAVSVTAEDPSGASVSDAFEVTVSNSLRTTAPTNVHLTGGAAQLTVAWDWIDDTGGVCLLTGSQAVFEVEYKKSTESSWLQAHEELPNSADRGVFELVGNGALRQFTIGAGATGNLPVQTGVALDPVAYDVRVLAYSGLCEQPPHEPNSPYSLVASTSVLPAVSNASIADGGVMSAPGQVLPGAGVPGLLTFAGQSVEALRLREGRAVREELPEAQGGEGALTYALSPELPAGLQFDADTRTISGTPLAPVAETRYTLTVTESEASAEATPQSASLSFLLEVGADTKPVFAQAVADMAFERNRPIEPRVLPLATGGEGELRYALEPFLPAGLYLDQDTRTISGTPETVREETLYRWTAVDSDGDMAVAEFRMTVVAEPSVASRAAWAHKAILPDLVRGATDMTLDAVGARAQQARTGDTQGLAAAGTGEAQLLGQRFAFGGRTDKNADPQSSALDSLPSLLQSTGPTLNTEDAGEALMQRMLEGASFRMHLGGGADGMGRRYTLWGQGGYRSLSAEQDGIAFSGGLSGLHLGADTRLSDTLLAGVAVSHSSAQMDYTETYRGEVLEGVYGFTLSGVHPYADWQHASGLGVWLSAGASRGEVQVWDRALEEQDAVRNALSVHALSGGVERPLARRGVWGLAFKADGSVSDVMVSDVGSADDIALRVSRLRMSVQADWELGAWSPYAELGLRHDGGAGGSGMGLEAGGGVRYSGSSGWQFEGEARSLALGAGSRREWQLQATLSRQPAAGAGGFRMRLSPAYGPAGGMSGVLDRLWSDGMSGSVAPALGGLLDAGAYQSRLDLELGYGWPVNRGLVELYGGGSAMAGGAVNPAANSGGRLHVGGRFEATAGWHVRLELQWDGSAAGSAPSAPGGMNGDVFSSGLFGGASASGVSGLADERLADVGPHTGEPARYGDSLHALGTAPLNPAGRGIVLTISSRSLGR